jgi:hypothetical protein
MACGMTQGHYSKLVNGRVELGPKSSRAMEAWLKQPVTGASATHPLADGSAQRLAASIRRDLARLSAMIGFDGAAREVGRGSRQRGGS